MIIWIMNNVKRAIFAVVMAVAAKIVIEKKGSVVKGLII